MGVDHGQGLTYNCYLSVRMSSQEKEIAAWAEDALQFGPRRLRWQWRACPLPNRDRAIELPQRLRRPPRLRLARAWPLTNRRRGGR